MKSRRPVNSTVRRLSREPKAMKSRRKISTLGFACGAGSFVAANLYSYQRAKPEGDFFAPFGVPFQMGGFGGFVGNTYLVWSGVVGNSLVALSAGLVAAGFLRESGRSRPSLRRALLLGITELACNPSAVEQVVGPERREREVIADFQLPTVDLICAARSTQTLGGSP